VKKYLICCGDSNDINSWSGIPFHILNMAKELSFEIKGLKLDPKKFSFLRYIWNLKQYVLSGNYSGFQYSDLFLNNLTKQINIKPFEEIVLISTFPLLPKISSPNNWNIFYYLDATTKQIFDEYRCFNSMSKEYRDTILHKEKKNFENSRMIFCMSEWARDSLIDDYKVPKKKILILPGGANIQKKYLEKYKLHNFMPSPPSINSPLKIGFLGQDWDRKGGPIVLDIVNKLNLNSIPTILRVVGVSEDKLPKSKYIQNVGFINKNNNMEKFISEIKSWHFGTLFSKAEAYGISNRECLYLGVPIICHDVGGIRSTLPTSGLNYGRIFKFQETTQNIADWVTEIILNYSSYIELRNQIIKNNLEYSWEPAVKKMFKSLSFIKNK